MQKIMATINIDMGKGPQNPIIRISDLNTIPKVIREFVTIHSLPAEAEKVILAQVQAELENQGLKSRTYNDKENCRPSLGAHQRRVSSHREKTPPMLKPSLIKGKNTSQSRGYLEVNRSPRRSNTPVKRNVYPYPQVQKQIQEQVMEKTFLLLMKRHPPNVKILCPEFVCFEGVGKRTLKTLQQFFKALQEEEQEQMDMRLFKKKLKELNYSRDLVAVFGD